MEQLTVIEEEKQMELGIEIKKVNLLLFLNFAIILIVAFSLEDVLKLDALAKYLVILLLVAGLFILVFVKYLLILDVASHLTNNLLNQEPRDVMTLKMLEKYLQALELLTMIFLFIIWIKAFELVLFEFTITKVYVLIFFVVMLFLSSFIELILQMKILHRTNRITWHRFRGMKNYISDRDVPLKKQDYFSEFTFKTYLCVSVVVFILVSYFDTQQNTITVTNWILTTGLIIFIIHELIYKICKLR